MSIDKHIEEHIALKQLPSSISGINFPLTPLASRGTATAVTNLLKNPMDLTGAAWSGDAINTNASEIILPAADGGKKKFQNFSTALGTADVISGHQYLWVLSAFSNSVGAIAGKARVGLQLGATSYVNPDDQISGAAGGSYGTHNLYIATLGPDTNTVSARFTATASGAGQAAIYSDSVNDATVTVNFRYAAVYDITGLTGLIYDAGINEYFDLSRQLVVYGDSLSEGIAWKCRDALEFQRSIVNLGGTNAGWTSAQVRTQVLTRPDLYGYPAIFWVGHNDSGVSLATSKSNIADITSGFSNFRIFTCVMHAGWVSPRTAASDRNDQLNEWILNTYGYRAIDVNPSLILNGDDSATDNTDVSWRMTPTSLRATGPDAIHLNNSGYDIVTDLVKSNLAGAWR